MQILLLHQQILLQTERLRDLHRSLMMHSSTIPAAEMDTLLQEIRNLYNLALQLNNENALKLLNEVQLAVTQSMPQNSPAPVQPPQESLLNGVARLEEIKEKPATVKITETPMQPVAKTETNTPEKKRIVSDIHDLYPDTPTFADRFSDHQTLGEKIVGTNGTKRVSDNLKTPVKDIKSAIGLNEKFQFINNLFKGDAKKYNAFIDQLNVSPSSETAMKAIKEISDSNDWESHAASAKSFMDVVERRFGNG